MNSMFDRLGSIIRSYLDNDGEDIFSKGKSSDPDYQDAYEELDNYLNDDDTGGSQFNSYNHFAGKTREAGNTSQRVPPRKPQSEKPRLQVPSELYKDFIRLGVAPGASMETCKAAHKNLLKKHHPDMHADNPFALNRATAISSSINASFQRICMWYRTGVIE